MIEYLIKQKTISKQSKDSENFINNNRMSSVDNGNFATFRFFRVNQYPVKFFLKKFEKLS